MMKNINNLKLNKREEYVKTYNKLCSALFVVCLLGVGVFLFPIIVGFFVGFFGG